MKITQMKSGTSENPFYGKRALLDLFQQGSKMSTPDKSQLFRLLDAAYKESSSDILRELFYSIVFSIGDIPNRDHNILQRTNGKGKSDQGGNGLRKAFIYCIEYIVKNDPQQFYKMLHLIPEYTNLENPFIYQLRTDRFKGKVQEVLSVIPSDPKEQFRFINQVTDFLARLINNPKSTDKEHELISKFLRKPRFSTRLKVSKDGKRSRRNLQEVTKTKESFEYNFIKALSEKLNWEIIQYPGNTRFKGLEDYKAKYNRLSESYLFSSKEIIKLDKETFFKWLDTLPSGARYRTQRHLFDVKNKVQIPVEKWGNLPKWYTEWEKAKVVANEVTRDLEYKRKVSGLNEEEEKTLKSATKMAKVNTGGQNIFDVLIEFFKGEQTVDSINNIADNLLRKMDLQVPVLPIVDISGSMAYSTKISVQNLRITPMSVAQIACTAFMLKNPDPDLQNVLVRFDDKCEIIYPKSAVQSGGTNKFMTKNTTIVEELVDPRKSFLENFRNVSKYIISRGGTNLSSVPNALKDWVDEIPSESEQRKEIICSYPVWLVISDGDLNSSYNATSSASDFQMKMKQYFGWGGVLVIWDVKTGIENDKSKFENLENIIYFGGFNPGIVNQVFTKIHDLDIIDIYTPLKSLYESNRYQLVRQSVKTVEAVLA